MLPSLWIVRDHRSSATVFDQMMMVAGAFGNMAVNWFRILMMAVPVLNCGMLGNRPSHSPRRAAESALAARRRLRAQQLGSSWFCSAAANNLPHYVSGGVKLEVPSGC
ncbi:MAG: hypothetical protein ACLRWQ_03560 [Flavonifractor plautii]